MLREGGAVRSDPPPPASSPAGCSRQHPGAAGGWGHAHCEDEPRPATRSHNAEKCLRNRSKLYICYKSIAQVPPLWKWNEIYHVTAPMQDFTNQELTKQCHSMKEFTWFFIFDALFSADLTIFICSGPLPVMYMYATSLNLTSRLHSICEYLSIEINCADILCNAPVTHCFSI